MFSKIRPIQWGVFLSVIAVFLSFLTGMWMGLDEEGIREGWKASGQTVLDSFYKGDATALEEMIGVAWTCLMRAHLHWAGIGAATLAMSFILLLVKVPNWYKQGASVLMGLGAIIYPISWLSISNNVVLVGKAAKADAHLIAALGIGCVVAGTVAVIASFIITFIKERKSGQQENTAA